MMYLIAASMAIRLTLYILIFILSFRHRQWGLLALAVVSTAGLIAGATPYQYDNHLAASAYAPILAWVAWRRLK